MRPMTGLWADGGVAPVGRTWPRPPQHVIEHLEGQAEYAARAASQAEDPSLVHRV
jgi:hypothetical protein